MNTRLKQFLAAENITQAQFADTINVVRASVSHVLAGRNNPSYEFIRSIMIKYPELNIEWLIFGKGKMYKDSQPRVDLAQDMLFPISEDSASKIEDTHSEQPVTEIIEVETSDKSIQTIVNQRKVSKVIILFDDGSYQEM